MAKHDTPCWMSSKKARGQASFPTSSVRRRKTRIVGIFLVNSNCLSEIRSPIGNTAESLVYSDMVVVLLVVNSDVPKQFPGVEHFHTVRVNQPASKYYSTANLRELMALWDKHGSGMTNMHGSTGDIILLGCRTEALEPFFWDLTHQMGQDLGGSGSNLRTPANCLGQSRCEWSCFDTEEACHHLTMHYQDEIHRPAFPYKFKFKFSGCAQTTVLLLLPVLTSLLSEPGETISVSIRPL